MPARADLRSILIIGSGPIVIGQACEFDYSGSQACKALRAAGYRVILVNSNPATIMTDPEMADRTYIEPLLPEVLEAILRAERPDALLPTLGGQTALNLAMELHRTGVLARYGVELIGARAGAIETAEDRRRFREAMVQAGLPVLRGAEVGDVDAALAFAAEVGYPVVVRPSFTLGGTGGGLAADPGELREVVARGLLDSPVRRILVEESVLGWKEFELEVMRDRADNVVVVCSIENLDPMGVHTGDSITVAPAQTLTDREYQAMRDAAKACMRAIGVETGGSNIQFAVNPADGRMALIEMNPRVSRSSALASKATGFPIAKIAALLAVGYTLDEIENDITKTTPASFEPTLDYVVVKVPRFDFVKFPGATDRLGTEMRSVGETMALGRTFPEALQKALRSLENGWDGLDPLPAPLTDGELREQVARPAPARILAVGEALRRGWPVPVLHRLTGIDPWFLHQMARIVACEGEVRQAARAGAAGTALSAISPNLLRRAKALGFSDRQLARLTGAGEGQVRQARLAGGIRPVFKAVDTCGGEFEARTPYFYSAYDREDESRGGRNPTVVILGGGPNRIGQGIEFDYCCVQAAQAAREAGYEVVMVNCNPETVSTDYDTSDRLYFEPLTLEDVLRVVEAEEPVGVILQFGGQTPLKLARALEASGVPILGTPPAAIHRAEDREEFGRLLDTLGLRQPPGRIARTWEEARRAAAELGYPLIVRPSYVLGGRAMEIVDCEAALRAYVAEAAALDPENPILLDRYLQDAVEIDADAVCDGERVLIGGVLEHVEEAGVHSGDSASILPPQSLPPAALAEVEEAVAKLARALGVVGLMNVQFAWVGGELYVLEVNPRASRTVPFVSKAVGLPLARLATRVMLGERLALSGTARPPAGLVAVKEVVFPFRRFRVDPRLGPEMRSTGEVMAFGATFAEAYARAQAAAGAPLPVAGRVLFTAERPADAARLLPLARRLAELGFQLVAAGRAGSVLAEAGCPVEVAAVEEGPEGSTCRAAERLFLQGGVALLISLPDRAHPGNFDARLRRLADQARVPFFTTVAGAEAAVQAVAWLRAGGSVAWPVRALQDARLQAARG